MALGRIRHKAFTTLFRTFKFLVMRVLSSVSLTVCRSCWHTQRTNYGCLSDTPQAPCKLCVGLGTHVTCACSILNPAHGFAHMSNHQVPTAIRSLLLSNRFGVLTFWGRCTDVSHVGVLTFWGCLILAGRRLLCKLALWSCLGIRLKSSWIQLCCGTLMCLRCGLELVRL